MARTRTNLDHSDDLDDMIEQDVEDEEAEAAQTEAVSDRRRRRQQRALEATGAATHKERPTPSTREQKPRGIGTTGFVNRIPIIRSVVAYFRGVSSEMRKVTWPERDETRRLTAVVLGVTIFFAIALGILDAFFSWWFHQAFQANSETVFLAVALVVALVVGGTYTLFRNRI